MKKLVIYMVLVCSVCGLVASQDKQKGLVQPRLTQPRLPGVQSVSSLDLEKQKQPFTDMRPSTRYVLKINDKEVPVTQAFLNQFGAYRTETLFKDKQRLSLIVTQKTRKRSMSVLELTSLPARKMKEGLQQGVQTVVWDITPLSDAVFDARQGLKDIKKEKLERKRFDATMLRFVDIALGKQDPSTIKDKGELFMTIQIADMLGHDAIMQRCNPLLVDKLMAGHPLRNWLVRTLHGHDAQIRGVTGIPGTPLLASCSNDSTLRIWNHTTGEQDKTVTDDTGYILYSVVPYGKNTLMTGSWDKKLKLWDYTTAAQQKEFIGHTDAVTSVASLQEKGLIISGSHAKDRSVRVWKSNTSECLQILEGHKKSVSSVVALQGKLIASGSYDKTVMIWNAVSGERACTLIGHKNAVTGLAYINKTDFVASASLDGDVMIWNYKTGTWVRTLTGKKGGVWCVAYIPDTKYVIAGTVEGFLLMWDYETGALVRSFKAHDGAVTCVAAVQGINAVASGSTDKTIKLWNFDPFIHFTFDRIAFLYDIFTSKHSKVIVDGSDDSETFLSFPQGLQDHIIQLKRIKRLPAQSRANHKKE